MVDEKIISRVEDTLEQLRPFLIADNGNVSLLTLKASI